ncbi:MAG: diaminopimelate epimerase [Chthoniobacterales bacterium]
MRLDFTKMNGAGNDFIMIDDHRHGSLSLSSSQIGKLCDRHRGIGADGLLILESGKTTLYRMRYYNADGHEAEMCGNGARCFTRYLARILGEQSGKISFQTEAGILTGELLGDQVRLMMSNPHSIQLSKSIPLPDQEYEVHAINTGVPHALIFVKDIELAPVIEVGRQLRHHSHFSPAGTNVNFVQILESRSLLIRTYERGVEDETLACGTGIVAAALIYHLISRIPGPISVLARGGDRLEVDFDSSSITQVTLTGPADFVFEGNIDLENF